MDSAGGRWKRLSHKMDAMHPPRARGSHVNPRRRRTPPELPVSMRLPACSCLGLRLPVLRAHSWRLRRPQCPCIHMVYTQMQWTAKVLMIMAVSPEHLRWCSESAPGTPPASSWPPCSLGLRPGPVPSAALPPWCPPAMPAGRVHACMVHCVRNGHHVWVLSDVYHTCRSSLQRMCQRIHRSLLQHTPTALHSTAQHSGAHTCPSRAKPRR